MRRFLFAATHRSLNRDGFTTMSGQVILPGKPWFCHRAHRPPSGGRRTSRLTSAWRRPAFGFAKAD
jgi:hypothetical protein